MSVHHFGFLWRKHKRDARIAEHLYSCIVLLSGKRSEREGVLSEPAKPARELLLKHIPEACETEDDWLEEQCGTDDSKPIVKPNQRPEKKVISLCDLIPDTRERHLTSVVSPSAIEFDPLSALPYMEVQVDTLRFSLSGDDDFDCWGNQEEDDGLPVGLKSVLLDDARQAEQRQRLDLAAKDAESLLDELADFVIWAFDTIGDQMNNTGEVQAVTVTGGEPHEAPEPRRYSDTELIAIVKDACQENSKQTAFDTAERLKSEYTPLITSLRKELDHARSSEKSLSRQLRDSQSHAGKLEHDYQTLQHQTRELTSQNTVLKEHGDKLSAALKELQDRFLGADSEGLEEEEEEEEEIEYEEDAQGTPRV